MHDINQSGINLNDDLERISNLTFQWKMSFNPAINKRAQEVIFSRRLQKSNRPSLTFNGTSVTQSVIEKYLDSKLDFKEHIQNVFNKVSKTIELLRKLQKNLPRPSLITIYKSFIRFHLDFEDIIYDQAYNVSFHQKIGSIQYNAALAITGAIRGTSRYALSWVRFWIACKQKMVSQTLFLCCFYKVFKTQSPRYLFEAIPTAKRACITRNNNKLPHFKNVFFPSTVINLNIRNSKSLTSFKRKVLKFIRPSESSIFLCNNPKGIQLLTRLRLGLSHFWDHKFKHNLKNTLNPICNCGEDIETSCHYLLHCSLYTNKILALLNVIQGIDNSILELTDSHIVEVLFYGWKFLDIPSSTKILDATRDFLLETRRFEERLF